MSKSIFSLFILIFTLSSFFSCTSSKYSSLSNMVAKMHVDEPIEGACDYNSIYALLPIGNQIEATHKMSEDEILKKLNEEVAFLKDKPNYSDKGMVGLIINCKGELIQTRTSNKTQNPDLDQQIVDVFATLKTWTPGTLNGTAVDSSLLFSFNIKDGKIFFD